MKSKRVILLLLSLVLAVGASALALTWLKGNAPEVPPQAFSMWVAKETIPAGTVIKSEMLIQKEVAGELPEGLLNTSEAIQGKTAKEAILKGEGFPEARMLSEEEKLLSMRLPQGNRAYSISVTQYSAVADLLKPGDRIDVFVFLAELEKDQVIIRPDIARLLLQNVEILSVRKESSAGDKPPEEKVDLYTLTLSVPVRDIEKLVFSAEKGVLKVALRPANATDTYTSYGVVWQELLLDPELNIREFFPDYQKVADPQIINSTSSMKPIQPAVVQAGTVQVIEATPATPAVKLTPAKKETSQKNYTVYTVRVGDTLMSISRDFFKGSASHYDDIMKLNGLSAPLIKPGQKLKIPVAGR